MPKPTTFISITRFEERMRALDVIVPGFLLLFSDSWRQLAAQEQAARNQFTLDASVLAAGLSYARLTSSDKLVGVDAGLGVEFNIRLVAGEKGGKIAPMWGWRHFRIGPRTEAGAYWSSTGPTFGIFITPLTARLLF